MTSHDNLPNKIQNLGDMLLEVRDKPYLDMMERQVEDLFQAGYHPEIDFSPELHEKVIEKHLHLISILRWSNEIRCIDITREVSMFSQHQCSPQEGNLDALY